MATVPIRRAQFGLPAFASWLADNGAEVRTPTNQYEVVRYVAHAEGHRKPVTHIVYTKENGMLTFAGGSREHYARFLGIEGDGSLGKKARPASSTMRRFRRQIVERDGHDCWFCGVATTEGDSSVEHLVNRSEGGPDTLANFVIAHPACNAKAGNMTLAAKITLRDRMRREQSTETERD